MKTVTTALENGILFCTLNRPEKLNALNAELLTELDNIINDARTNPDVKALLITGSGRAFCAGADISQLAEADANSGLDFAERGQTLFRALETLGKPSLAAINGVAFGGGCELAMAATLRIASTDAKFAQPEVKLGVIPGYGGTVRLSRLVGKGRTLDLCLSGRSIEAETAYQWGLISEVTSPSTLISRATTILEGITQLAPLAIKAIMQTIDIGFDSSIPEAQKIEALQFAMTCATADKQEGISAYLEKRPPHFKGR